ncbi:MAG: hypothetical protein U5M53_01500 [Rhodoferax sp.]|nr:hypothetical protein [Rhodoferax sp.]
MTQTMPRIAHAAQRLTRSRVNLRQALRAQPPATSADDTPLNGATALAWMAILHKVPGVDVVIQALQAWWIQQPLQPATAATWDALKESLPPVARRHPVALLAATAALGGLLVVSRPWRWAFKPALFAALLPQLLSAILVARAKPPETADLF